jgi:1-acyl-sn-glycerol-3-phosphate acyltransferase
MLTLPVAGLRTLRFTLHLGYGVLLAIALPALGNKQQRRILQSWSAALLTIMHVRISTSGAESLPDVSGGLVVANHISWLDVIVLNSILPLRFVAKSEVRRWPVIGWLCAQAQTLFIARHKRSDTAHTNRKMVEALQQGNCMALFPEGTTTDGSQVKHFHASLLQPAIEAQTRIYPVAIRYHDTNGNPNTDAAYIDEMSFIESLWKILRSRDLHVHVCATGALDTQTAHRRTLAQDAHRQISHALALPPLAAEARAPHRIGDDTRTRILSPYSLLLYAPIKPLPHKAQ